MAARASGGAARRRGGGEGGRKAAARVGGGVEGRRRWWARSRRSLTRQKVSPRPGAKKPRLHGSHSFKPVELPCLPTLSDGGGKSN